MKLKIISLLIVLILGTHFIDFIKTNSKYEILQVDKDLSDYSQYFKEKIPIVFTNRPYIRDLMSSLSIVNRDKKNIQLKQGHFAYHNKDRMFILSNSDNVELTLIAPDQIKNFKSANDDFDNLNIKTAKNNKYTSIKIKLYRDNIVSVPRYWLFSISNNSSFNIYYSDTIFTFIFTIYQIFPFLLKKVYKKR